MWSENIAHNFPEAADLYSKAIELNPKDATLWCNRAYTRIKLEEHGYAMNDACKHSRSLNRHWLWSCATSDGYPIGSQILEGILPVSNPLHNLNWGVKVLIICSRATCYLQTLQYKKAITDFKKVLALEPQNAVVKQQLDSTQKLLRRVEFEKVSFLIA